MEKRHLLALLAVGTALVGSWAWSEQGRHQETLAVAEFNRKRLDLVEADNERLRSLLAGYERAKQSEKQASQRLEIERATSRIRGLPFKTPVVYDVLTRDGIKNVLQQKLAEQYSDEEFERVRLGYVAMGLLPADYPLKQSYIDLLGEQVAAFYDQHSHRLFMFEDALLDSPQNRVILSHELTHALQDQHFDLKKLPLEIKDNDDRALAASALVEGDATLEMNAFMAGDLSLKGLVGNVAGVFTQSLDKLQSAPRILRESLLFPYLSGLRFCTLLQNEEGGISALFNRVPASTAQILHPEKYLANEQPIAVEWPEVAALNESPLADNVMGELGTRILLSDWTDEALATRVAAGWRGDRYLVFDQGRALVWRTLWSSPQAAADFLEAAKQMLNRRYQAFPTTSAGTAPETGRKLRLKLVGASEVLLVDASDDRWAEALAEKFGR